MIEYSETVPYYISYSKTHRIRCVYYFSFICVFKLRTIYSSSFEVSHVIGFVDFTAEVRCAVSGGGLSGNVPRYCRACQQTVWFIYSAGRCFPSGGARGSGGDHRFVRQRQKHIAALCEQFGTRFCRPHRHWWGCAGGHSERHGEISPRKRSAAYLHQNRNGVPAF